MNVTLEDLLQIIGKQTVKLELADAQAAALSEELARAREAAEEENS